MEMANAGEQRSRQCRHTARLDFRFLADVLRNLGWAAFLSTKMS
jgi:hypothetical protein